MNLQLYNYFRSSTSYRVRIAMHIKGLSFDYKPIHLLNNGGEQHGPEFRSLNPAGEVPTLIHDGKVISQSMAIIEYLEECFPKPSLYPVAKTDRARVRQFSENINCVHSMSNLKVTRYLEKEWKVTEEQKGAWIHEWMHRCFESLESMALKDSGKFCFGDEVTVADLFLIPMIFSAKRFQVDVDRYQNLSRINKACLELPAFQKAHPLAQMDTPAELQKK